LTYGLSYSWQTSDKETDRRTLPENMISANLGFIHAPFRANLLLKYVGPYDSNFFSTDSQYHEIGDYTRVDANVSYDFNLWDMASTLTVYGQNLLDDQYETRLGWKDTGLTAGVELAVKF
ncbi:MAG: TonB-dependent receptor, partial [Opitutae bacterium]|nr:TonB-dependent receptor [Opitutae bacterium]